jgi:hypothetical protein
VSADELTPYERLMAEALPTGTFGGARPPKPQRRTTAAPAARSWTPEAQAAHVETLLNGLDGFELHDEYAEHKRDRHREKRAEQRPRLRLITTEPADETAA